MPGLTSPLNFPYPLYTEANNGPAQIQALAEAIDDAIVASQALINSAVARKAFRMSAVTNQSVPNNTATNATFVTEDFDNDNIVNLAGSTTNAVIQTAGLYLFTGVSFWTANVTGIRTSGITKNGTLFGALQTRSGGGTLPDCNPITLLINAVPGDIFRLQLTQTSGGALNSTFRVFSGSRVSG